MPAMHANKVQPHRFSRCGLRQDQLVMYIMLELGSQGGAGAPCSSLREQMLYTLRHHPPILIAY